MTNERWLWKVTIMSSLSMETFEWAIADDIGQVLDWANGKLALEDEDEIIQIERVSLAEIIPSSEGHTAGLVAGQHHALPQIGQAS